MLESIEKYLTEYPMLSTVLQILGVILLAVISYFITKKVIIRILQSVVRRTKTKYDDILLNETILRRASYLAPLIVVYRFSYIITTAHEFVSVLTEAATILLIIITIGTFLTAVNEAYDVATNRERPIKGYIQVIKIILYIIGGIFIIGLLTGRDLIELLAGIGALTAVLILVFKDTILSFIASIQITSYGLIKLGDWIEVPSYGADGDVIDIALHTVKVRNFDKTITTVPTYKLIEGSFKNWRGMQETGGRRIKRAVHIDLSSIKFVDENMLKRFQKFQLLKDYIQQKVDEIQKDNETKKVDTSELINGRRMTNIGTFRAYIKAYLKSRSDIHPDLTFLVRQLPSGPTGIPIEIYIFTKTTNWVEYEEIQADIFDHLLAVVPLFDLQVFQSPSSSDIQKLSVG